MERVASELLIVGTPSGISRTRARSRIRQAVQSGAALAKFRAFVAAQGGDPAYVDDPGRLPSAPIRQQLSAQQSGYIAAIDAREIGLAAVDLGGGRHKKTDLVDHRVGIVLAAKVGAPVAPGAALCTIHAADAAGAERVASRIRAAFTIRPDPCPPLPIILDRISSA